MNMLTRSFECLSWTVDTKLEVSLVEKKVNSIGKRSEASKCTVTAALLRLLSSAHASIIIASTDDFLARWT